MKNLNLLRIFLVPIVVVTLFFASFAALAGVWQKTIAPSFFWRSVAVSADGTKILAAGSGNVCVSTNFGTTWTTSNVPLISWITAASSADGKRLVVGGDNYINPNLPGCICSSTNFGNLWVSNSLPLTNWNAVASSADGLKLIACPYGFQSPSFSSTNGGSTWITNNSSLTSCSSVACSSDGTKDVVVNYGGNGIYSSADLGAHWKQRNFLGQYWSSVTASADGSRFYAASIVGNPNGGYIYASTNSGTNWTLLAGAPMTNWTGIASSADGTRLVAVVGGYSGGYVGPIYLSEDSGATWTRTDAPITNWTAVACSADGTRLVAASAYSGIYVARLAPPLTINLLSTNVILSWTASSNAFALQDKGDLKTPGWQMLTNQPQFNSTTLLNQVTIPVSNSYQFYQLSAP